MTRETKGALVAEIDRLRQRLAELEDGQRHQKRTEDALRLTARRAEAVIESASQAIVIVEQDGRIAAVNAKAEEMFGYPRAELLGQPIETLLPERLRDRHRLHRVDYFANPRIRPMGQGLELTGRRKDGREFPVEISLSYCEVEGGMQAVAFVTDISERKRAEEALRRSEARASALLEAASEGVVIADRHGRIAFVNAKTEELFGYSRAELVGQLVEILLPERYRGRHPRHRDGYFASPRTRPMGRGLDLTARRKDGREFPVEISLSHIETEEGAQTLAMVTDITQRLAADRAARQAERLASLGSLSAGVAHEINNPIGIITSRIELMLLEGAEQGMPAAMVDDLQVLHRNATRVARIAQGFLSFARQSPTERAPVDLGRVIAQTLELVERQMGERGVRIVTQLDETLPPLLGHANALQQVLLNLVTNARDAMDGEGEIRIETGLVESRPDWLCLRVSDDGPGISPETLPHIFDPFYTTKPTGTGLGLSVSYGIIRDHNGTVDVESVPGKGTTFILTFPALREGD